MTVTVSMPQLGESVTEGTVTRWLKKEGERVEADEPLLEVSTDKVDTEIPSPVSGILRGITVAEDETVAVGAQLAIIDEGSDGAGAAAAPAAAEPAALPPASPPPGSYSYPSAELAQAVLEYGQPPQPVPAAPQYPPAAPPLGGAAGSRPAEYAPPPAASVPVESGQAQRGAVGSRPAEYPPPYVQPAEPSYQPAEPVPRQPASTLRHRSPPRSRLPRRCRSHPR